MGYIAVPASLDYFPLYFSYILDSSQRESPAFVKENQIWTGISETDGLRVLTSDFDQIRPSITCNDDEAIHKVFREVAASLSCDCNCTTLQAKVSASEHSAFAVSAATASG